MKLKTNALTLLASLTVVACGGSGGDDSKKLVASDTDSLKNTAASSLGRTFDTNAKSASSVVNSNRSVLVDTTSEVAGVDNDPFADDIVYEPIVEESIQDLINSSLAIGDDSKGTTTRSGNTITIDPDDDAMCRELVDMDDIDTSDLDNCLAIVKDIKVVLEVSGEEAGEIDYVFQNQSVLKLGYGPNRESVEWNLGGFKTFAEAAAELENSEDSDSDDFPEVMTGSFKFTTTTTNDTEGKEAGSLAWEIVEQVNLSASNDDGVQESISMNPGTLFSIDVDAGNETGSMFFDVGSISSVFDHDEGLGRLNLKGFTATAAVNPENDTLVVSDLSLSNGPLSVSIDNEEVLKMTMQNFGFRVDEASEGIIIDGDMDLSVLIDSAIEPDLEEQGIARQVLSAMAPSGTIFSRAGNGNIKIGGTGPFSVSLRITNDDGSFDDELFTVNAGECIDDDDDDDIASGFGGDELTTPVDSCS